MVAEAHLSTFLWGFTELKYVKVSERVSWYKWSFPQLSQQSQIPLANTPAPTQGLGCHSHSPCPIPPPQQGLTAPQEGQSTYLQVGLAFIENQLGQEYIWQVTDTHN